MSEAVQYMRTKDDIRQHIRDAKDAGISYQTMYEESGVNRGTITDLANGKEVIVSNQKLQQLWVWVDGYEARRNAQSAFEAEEPSEYRQDLPLITTASYTNTLGVCEFAHENRGIAVIVGMPGTGKTTIAKTLPSVLPNVVSLEAWPMMRLGDLLHDIAAGLGIRVSGSLTNKARQIEQALMGKDVTLVIDEGEMLHKWDSDKIEVLRKIHDHTDTTMILLGTPKLLEVINRMDTTQLSSRMYYLQMGGATAIEIREKLNEYNIDPGAADALSEIASDAEHGGMRSYTMMMRLCLQYAAGGCITKDLLRAARKYKPGLKGCV